MDSSMKSFNPNKHMKEQFVSNLTGSSMLELFVLSAIFPIVDKIGNTLHVFVLLVKKVCFMLKPLAFSILYNESVMFASLDHVTDDTSSNKKDTTTVASRNRRGYISTMIVDFLSIILPFTLFCTVLADWTYINGVLCMVVLLFFAASQRHGSCWDQKEGVHSLSTYVSSYRVSMMLITCICILAVDFKIFPRRYAKTETYGTSVMDTGVGAFVFANSFVSRQARGVSTMGLRSALSSTSPLLVLGFARLVTTTGVDYQVHVGEYGVHWNFFFTLAGVAVLTSIVNVSPKYCGLVGSLVLIGYQVWLMNGLNSYLLSAERGTDIISQNKEGIYSIFGEANEPDVQQTICEPFGKKFVCVRSFNL
ncbi:putative phosphatidylinositol anchor biosynthesis protein PIGW/GWT1 [Helianthus annuus]|nr:putative phosphatidylinositol anchor biosynthesis protein PIGW/GWT1 [Helianthus annuus]KAJ0786804.1 putative phosphatidylinositol anchor biosynthesis protein PIGW/GWT1 [Helianthus annuus]